ncbi:PAS domain S-box protein [Desulfomicrobium baculatum]|uniref:Sensory/regulatory protein RpfC n=1 Tax=Desulfomicrobium baculatum (strain DSM 4028 / VKM B-1378 / X) TaxID=525897 RepID=C7LQP5_DESBD|nr:PAS domain S-box protein [Desulfomicrobium baculatum]ACU91551.1 multi-sensor hybrid histidine kinase [Desulfomicrobium baculatum DSM 4028]
MRFCSTGISLRTSIPLLLVGVILFSTVLVSWVSFTGSRAAVGDVGLQLRKEVSHRISEHLLEFLRLPHEINRRNALALQNGLVPAADPQGLISRFAEQVDLFPSVSSIYFGNAQGGLANSGRDPERNSRYSIRTDDFKAGTFRRYAMDSRGVQGEELSSAAGFDARTRPWYTKALSANGPVWSDVYVLFTGQDLALAASRPVYDSHGTALGVVSVDVFLSQLTRFLQQLRIGSTGKAFILDRTGVLVAGSGTEPLFVPARGGNPGRRILGTQSRDLLVHAASQALSSRFGNLEKISAEHHFEFSGLGQHLLVTVSPLRDPLGIDWLIVVAVPESDFMARIGDNARVTAIIMLGVLALSLLVGTLLARRIVKPISGLEEAAGRLAGDSSLEMIGETSRFVEVQSLTRSFNRMARQLSQTMQGMKRELTERQWAEAALGESESRYRALVELAVDGILLGSHEGVITGANECMCDLTGLTREDMLGMHISALPFKPESLEREPFRFEQLEHGDIVQKERVLIRPDGTEILVEMRSKMMPDGTYQSIFRDVTARRKAEAALRESEERLRMLSDNLPGGLVYQIEVGLDGRERRFTYISGGVESLHGLSVQDVLDDASVLYAQLPEKDGEQLAEREAEALSAMSLFHAEARFRLASGKVRWSYLASAPRRIGDRVVWDGVEIDITELKKTEAALLEAKETAETANRVKTEFLANMSHEIRTPLNGILGMMQLLRQTSLEPEQEKYVELSITSAARLTRLLADILDISRIEAGKMSLFNAPFSAAELVDSVVELFAVPAREKGLRLRCAIHPGLPPLLVGDEARVRQILFNLVGNALKYTEQGDITLELFARDADLCRSECMCIRVVDTGVGIPAHMLSGVFEPFRQVEGSHTRSYEGAGLGLAIVQRLVELMQGEISVQSEPGAGTAVLVSLPLRAASEYCIPQDVAESVALEAGPGLRLLLAEDEAINQLAMRTLLEKAGHRVSIAQNGQEVLDLLREEDFDCVLMDVQMPVMSGIEATRRIRTSPELAARKDVPIIALTAHAMSGDRESFLQAGMDDYLSKPVGLDDLVKAIAKLKSRSSA